MKTKTLSDKTLKIDILDDVSISMIMTEDIKYFIKNLKSELLTKGQRPTRKRIKEVIERLAGDELIK